MADELSLLWKLRADNTQAKTVVADTRAAVATLQRSFGPELAQSVSIGNKALAEIGNNVANLAAQRIPLVGNAVISVTSHLKGFNEELRRGGPGTAALARQIDSLSKSSGKSTSEIARFLTTFVRLEGASARNEAALKVFGGSVDLIGNKTAKFLPELEKAGAQLAIVSGESAAAGAAIGGMALPIAIAIAAAATLAASLVVVTRELFELSKRAADFQGRMFDLAQQTGLAVETLSALEIQARKTGGEVGGSVLQSIVAFQRKLDEAQDPLSKTAELFRDLNINVDDTETALRQAFAALAAMPEGFKQTNAAAELFGSRGGKQILAILKESGGDLDAVIRKARELGILIDSEAARAADKFNDDLALLEFQIRALTAVAAKDLIPAFAELIKATGDIVTALRPLISLFGQLAGATVRGVASGLKLISASIQGLIGDYRALNKIIRESNSIFKPIDPEAIPTQQVPPLAPVPLPGTPSPQEAANDAVIAANTVVAALKRTAAAHNQALEQLFEQGRINREKQANDTIAQIQKVAKAETDRIDALLAQKVIEAKALDRETDAYRKLVAEVNKLQQDRLDKEAEADRQISAIRAKTRKERADSLRNEEQNRTDLFIGETDRQIKEIEARIARGAQAESDGLRIIELLEQEKIAVRRESLQEQKRIGFLTIQQQKDLDAEIRKLEQEADRLRDEQQQRRLARVKATADREREIRLFEIDATLDLQRVAAERIISTQQALADLRVQSEEETAKKILKIRLDLIDQATEAVKTKLTAAKSITDTDERVRVEAELNAQLKALAEERKTIQVEGDRLVDAGRQRDLESERRYADELKRIKEEIRDVELEAAREVIDLMRAHFASRKDIVRAQRDLELAEEDARHERATESIRAQQRELDEQIRLLESHLKSLKIGTQEEIEEHDRLIKKLEELRLKREELKRQREAEDERSKTRKRRVKKDADKNEDDADPLGRIGPDVENLKEFASVIEDSIVPLGEILRNTFLQVADAIGQTVANWVLLGETGPAVMRKILAQALASIAAEAAVNAIKELALGFATLFFNPAESAAHFTAAGLWAAIGGVAAVAGRGVAGDLFKQKTPGTSGSAGQSGPNELNPLTLQRNTQIQPQKVVVEVRVKDSEFGRAITGHVVKDVHTAGPIREALAGDGNLSR